MGTHPHSDSACPAIRWPWKACICVPRPRPASPPRGHDEDDFKGRASPKADTVFKVAQCAACEEAIRWADKANPPRWVHLDTMLKACPTKKAR